ncbi:MAG: hypothetical protein M9898_05455 [Chitinophagaceae bacterium]|nr:hypothetical protein [Chitinophagaceae bacterium]
MLRYRFFIFIILGWGLFSCSRKHIPSRSAQIIYSPDNVTVIDTRVGESVPASDTKESKEENRTVVVAPSSTVRKGGVAKAIYVNDAAAKTSVDGRLYYDVDGKRYWKNYKDGKYYLFNKSMFDNPDFKPPVKN